MSEPWEEYPHIWGTKAKFFAWMRGAFRRALWEKYPPKIEFKNEQCTPPPKGYTGRAKSGANCALTGEWEGKSKLEVDHIQGHVSLKDWEDVLPFVLHMCTGKENMQLVSKEAHKIKSYAERMGISFEDALIEKQIIQVCKLKAADQQKWLSDRGIEPLKNAAQRKQQIREVLLNEQR